jgi:hypothetical protein
LAEDKIDSSDEDEFQEERTGMFSGCPMRRPLSLPVGACSTKTSYFSNFSTIASASSAARSTCPSDLQPDLLREALALKKTILKNSKTENNLIHLNRAQTHNGGNENNCLTFDNINNESHIVVLVDEEYQDASLDKDSDRKSKPKRQRKRDRLTKSCIAQ